jgi:hypothetical protein
MIRMLASWVMFCAAVASFSKLWVGVRSALDGHRLYAPLEALAWMGVFLASMGYLGFVIYAGDRAAGRTRRAIPMFDRLVDRQRPRAGGVGAGREP